MYEVNFQSSSTSKWFTFTYESQEKAEQTAREYVEAGCYNVNWQKQSAVRGKENSPAWLVRNGVKK